MQSLVCLLFSSFWNRNARVPWFIDQHQQLAGGPAFHFFSFVVWLIILPAGNVAADVSHNNAVVSGEFVDR